MDAPRGFNWFKYTTIGVTLFFTSVIVYVVYTAQTRSFHGVTGLDASQIHAMRHESNLKYAAEKMAQREEEQ